MTVLAGPQPLCPACGAPAAFIAEPLPRAGVEYADAACAQGHEWRVAWRPVCQHAADAVGYVAAADATAEILAGLRETGCADAWTLRTLEGARRWAVRLAGEATER